MLKSILKETAHLQARVGCPIYISMSFNDTGVKLLKSSHMVTVDQLVTAVVKMRKAQKDYSRSKTSKQLSEVKIAEAEVDRLLTEFAPTNVAVRAEQMDLFKKVG